MREQLEIRKGLRRGEGGIENWILVETGERVVYIHNWSTASVEGIKRALSGCLLHCLSHYSFYNFWLASFLFTRQPTSMRALWTSHPFTREIHG